MAKITRKVPGIYESENFSIYSFSIVKRRRYWEISPLTDLGKKILPMKEYAFLLKDAKNRVQAFELRAAALPQKEHP